MDKIKIVADFAPELSECTLHLFLMFHCMVLSFLLIFVTQHEVCFFNPVVSENLGIGQKRWGTL